MTHHVRMTHSLHSSLGYHLSRASRVQERRLDDGLRLLGITRTTWCILLAVGNEGLTRPSDIAAFIGIHRTATSRALRLMEDGGLVAGTAGAEDRRTTAVELTPLGQQRLAEGTPLAVANNPAMAKRLFKAEHPQLVSLLGRLTRGAEALEKIWGRPSRPHHGSRQPIQSDQVQWV